MTSESNLYRKLLFDQILRGIRLRSSVYFRPQFRAPWGISVSRHCAVFHIVMRGSCSLEVKGMKTPAQLSAGDFVVVTRGTEHTLQDASSTPTVNFFELVRRHASDGHSPYLIDGDGPITNLVCGGMVFENSAVDPLLAILPPVLHVKAKGNGARHWLGLTTKYVSWELDNGGAGASEVVTRLADILFIQAVRNYFDENADSEESGWLAAARDPQIGRVLKLLHEHPQKPWTVALLASQLAASRSALAARFTLLVGEPPFRYLTRLRINEAARRLRSTSEKLGAIAGEVGYESVGAFVKSFKRQMGMTPGQFRRTPQSNPPK